MQQSNPYITAVGNYTLEPENNRSLNICAYTFQYLQTWINSTSMYVCMLLINIQTKESINQSCPIQTAYDCE